jgi:hypothetical protein
MAKKESGKVEGKETPKVVTGKVAKKVKKVKATGPSCVQACKYVKRGGCSLGLDFAAMGRCNYSKWGKHLPNQF